MSSARILDIPDREYRADVGDVPSLSQSCAHILLTKSPLHAWNDHPKLGNNRVEESTQAKDDGTLMHKLILGKGTDIALIPADDYRTSAAKELRDAARNAGKLPVLERKYMEAAQAAKVIRENIAQYAIKFTGQSEVAAEWFEDGEHGPVRCRGRFDHVDFDAGVILDLKKARSAHPKAAARSMIDYGAHIQHAAYSSALEKLRPDHLGRTDFIFLFVEMDAPYAVLPARPDGAMRELGQMAWDRAVKIWERCLRMNRWPAYVDSITTLAPPPWMLTEEISNDW